MPSVCVCVGGGGSNGYLFYPLLASKQFWEAENKGNLFSGSLGALVISLRQLATNTHSLGDFYHLFFIIFSQRTKINARTNYWIYMYTTYKDQCTDKLLDKHVSLERKT